METIQHIIIDDTLSRVGDAQFADYLCHAYCYDGYCTFQRNGQSFRFEAGDCLIIVRRGDLVINLKESRGCHLCDAEVHRTQYAAYESKYQWCKQNGQGVSILNRDKVINGRLVSQNKYTKEVARRIYARDV